MTLNEKEQRIARIIAIVVVGAGAYFGWSWWSGARDDLDSKINAQQTKETDNNKTVDFAKKAEKEYASLNIPQLDPAHLDMASADRLVQQTFYNGGLVFTSWAGNAARALPKNKDFMEAHYTASATTTTARLARFLQYIEHAKIPARIDSVTIATLKPGVDNLRVEFTISALLYTPKAATPATKPGAKTTTAASQTSRPATGTGQEAGPTPATLSSDVEKKLEAEMAKRREEEAARLATLPEAPKRTPEQIEADMEAARAKQETVLGPATTSQPATSTAPGGTQ